MVEAFAAVRVMSVTVAEELYEAASREGAWVFFLRMCANTTFFGFMFDVSPLLCAKRRLGRFTRLHVSCFFVAYVIMSSTCFLWASAAAMMGTGPMHEKTRPLTMNHDWALQIGQICPFECHGSELLFQRWSHDAFVRWNT